MVTCMRAQRRHDRTQAVIGAPGGRGQAAGCRRGELRARPCLSSTRQVPPDQLCRRQTLLQTRRRALRERCTDLGRFGRLVRDYGQGLIQADGLSSLVHEGLCTAGRRACRQSVVDQATLPTKGAPPGTSIAQPVARNMTSAPRTSRNSVLSTNAASASGLAALAGSERDRTVRVIAAIAPCAAGHRGAFAPRLSFLNAVSGRWALRMRLSTKQDVRASKFLLQQGLVDGYAAATVFSDLSSELADDPAKQTVSTRQATTR